MDFGEARTLPCKTRRLISPPRQGDQPRVRAFAMWFADAPGFYYYTGTSKSVWQQLQKNPRVESCFSAPNPPGAGKTLRVSGAIDEHNDPELQERLFRDRPWLQPILSERTADMQLVIFRVSHGEARFWGMEYNLFVSMKRPV